MCYISDIIGIILNLIMELLSLEEDDSGVFITQNGSDFLDNYMESSDEDFVMPSSQRKIGDVMPMQYSDISEDESSVSVNKNYPDQPNFE